MSGARTITPLLYSGDQASHSILRSGIWSGRDIITVDKATVDVGPF